MSLHPQIKYRREELQRAHANLTQTVAWVQAGCDHRSIEQGRCARCEKEI